MVDRSDSFLEPKVESSGWLLRLKPLFEKDLKFSVTPNGQMQKVISFEKAGVCPLATQLWFRASFSLSSAESLKDRDGLGTSFHIYIAAAMLGCRDFVTPCSPCLCLCFWYSQWVSICGVPLQQIGGLLLSLFLSLILSLFFCPLHTLSPSPSLPFSMTLRWRVLMSAEWIHSWVVCVNVCEGLEKL